MILCFFRNSNALWCFGPCYQQFAQYSPPSASPAKNFCLRLTWLARPTHKGCVTANGMQYMAYFKPSPLSMKRGKLSVEEMILLHTAGLKLPQDAGSSASLKVQQGGCESRGWTPGMFVGEKVTLIHEKLCLYLVLMIMLISVWVY